MTRLYLAAPFAGRDLLVATEPFTAAGHEVTSGWLRSTRPLVAANLGTSAAGSQELVQHHARMDLSEVEAAQVLVHYTANFLRSLDPTLGDVTHQLHSGGRHVETGFALCLGMPIIILGEPENIFQRGLGHICPTLSDALDVLDEMSSDWA